MPLLVNRLAITIQMSLSPRTSFDLYSICLVSEIGSEDYDFCCSSTTVVQKPNILSIFYLFKCFLKIEESIHSYLFVNVKVEIYIFNLGYRVKALYLIVCKFWKQ